MNTCGKYATRLLELTAIAALISSGLVALVRCSGAPLQVTDPAQLCATELAKLPAIQDEAMRAGMPTQDFAAKVCDAALLAVRVGKAHLPPPADKALPELRIDAGTLPGVDRSGNAAGAAGTGG